MLSLKYILATILGKMQRFWKFKAVLERVIVIIVFEVHVLINYLALSLSESVSSSRLVASLFQGVELSLCEMKQNFNAVFSSL